jgi:hypothetical protein
MWLYQTNTHKCTNILLSQHFANTIRHSNTLQPSKGHLQRAYLKHSSSNLNKNELSDVKFDLVSSVCCIIQQMYHIAAAVHSITATGWQPNCSLTIVSYTPRRWPCKGWNMLELRIVLIKLCLDNIWLHLSVFVSYSNISARVSSIWLLRFWSPGDCFRIFCIVLIFTLLFTRDFTASYVGLKVCYPEFDEFPIYLEETFGLP